jgi:hypothetical protein
LLVEFRRNCECDKSVFLPDLQVPVASLHGDYGILANVCFTVESYKKIDISGVSGLFWL